MKYLIKITWKHSSCTKYFSANSKIEGLIKARKWGQQQERLVIEVKATKAVVLRA